MFLGDVLSPEITARYDVRSYKNAHEVLNAAPGRLQEIEGVLNHFSLTDADILAPGGGKSAIATRLDSFLYARGWKERKFTVPITAEGETYKFTTHSIDCFTPGIALEVEWNNKDTFFDRDLSAFRILYNAGIIECAVVITRSTSLDRRFKRLVAEEGMSHLKFSTNTTHFDRLVPRMLTGASGDCPVIAFGITEAVFDV